MCGIAGGIGRVSEENIRDVGSALRHRGPDDSGCIQDGPLWLLNTRLAIQDRSQAGHQPMRSGNGRYSLVFNGEIFNHLDIRRQHLSGAEFNGDSDTETLLYCWEKMGESCLNTLEGDFAFAVYDHAERMLFLTRDRMGVKPLYWYFDGAQFAFASELKALLRLPLGDPGLDPSVFGNYLLYQYNPDERTPFERIRKLPPSHLLRISLREMQPGVERYYRLPFGGNIEHRSAADWIRQTHDSLEHAVRSQLLSDAPLGLTLSGGLDSALVAAFARKARPDQAFTAYCIDTHGGMTDEGFAEDAAYAKLAAKHLNLRLELIPGDYDLGAELDAMVYALDEPQADPAAINIRLIAKAARADGNSVLLSGTGADDLFSGYRRHQLLHYQTGLQYFPGAIRVLAPLLANFSAKHPTIRRIEKVLRTAGRPPVDAAIHSFFWNEPGRIGRLFKEPVAALEQPYQLFQDLLQEIPVEQALLNKILFLEQRSFLPHHNLAYMDKLSMAESVEMRVPFADRNLVELAAALPLELKMNGTATKQVLRKIAGSYLPAAIIDRPKTGFAFPLRSWMRGADSGLVRDRLLDSTSLDDGIFNRREVTRLVEQTLSGRRDGTYTVFSLLCIESWLRQFTARP